MLDLAQQLRRDGIAAELDQFHQEELLHWPRWCEEQMRPENADFVLCVCTAEYARRVEGRVPADVGKGVFWEGTLIYNELYDAKGNPRCVPVLLDGGKDTDIPRILRNWTWFRLDAVDVADTASGYASLWRLVNRQASVTPATVGALPQLERRTDFMAELAKQLAGIKDDTQAILAHQADHQALLARIAESARTYRPGALHQLKAPPEHFTGRAEKLAQVCAALRGGGAVAVSAVNGLGGVGKTALAIMAAHALRAEFPDMQLFIELRAHSPNPVTAEAARDGVLQAAHPEARLPESEAARWALYRALFEGQRALVVLDDAADDGQVEPLRPPPGSALLVTSRRKLRAGAALRLDRLPRAEAVGLLHAWAPRLTEAEAERLAGLCGDLPVALKAAGGYLKAYRAKPVAEYLAELEANRLQRLGNSDQPADDVNVVFEASERALAEPERRAWTALSVMSADFGREAGKAVIESAEAGDLLDRLVNLNLLEYGEESGRFGWHDLLREFAAARLSAEAGERARVAHAVYFIGIAEQTQALYLQGNEAVLEGLALFDRERAQLEMAFDFLASMPRRYASLMALVNGVTYTGDLRFAPYQRIRWLEAQLDAARRLDFWEAEGSALGNLGIEYRRLKELGKAIEYQEQDLAIRLKFGDRRGEGNALGNLAITYVDLGDTQKAIACFVRRLDIAREFKDWRGESNALSNLGITYAQLNQASKAIEYFEQALVIDGLFGNLRGKGSTLSNTALAYEALGERREAICRAEQALAIFEAIEDPNAAMVRAQLAAWHAEGGGGSE